MTWSDRKMGLDGLFPAGVGIWILSTVAPAGITRAGVCYSGVAMRMRHNIADVRRQFRTLTKSQVPFATALALNDTAADGKLAAEDAMRDELDRPTPFTQRGLYQGRASKDRLQAVVGFRAIQGGYMRKQIEGGVREPEGRALLIPKAIRLNQYGNMARRAVAQAMGRGTTFVASRGKGKTGHLRPGIYRRDGRKGAKKLSLMVAFADRARYGKRFDFRGAVLERARQVYRAHFARRLNEALRTAR